MRAVVYRDTGSATDVLEVVERPVLDPGPGEARVRLLRAGVNPTDWKFRANGMNGPWDEVVPGQDGAGVVEAVGPDVTGLSVGDRVWTVLAQYQRPGGTAAEHTVQPVERLARLPEAASYDLGAALGVPAVTAHRALTAGEVTRLSPRALAGRVVLVAGGAGAVGNAAIQLAAWAGATVVATISSQEKADLALAAGAHHVVDYTGGVDTTVSAVRALAPDGVDLVVEVSLTANVDVDVDVLRTHGTISYYADNGGESASVPVRATFAKNLRLQGVLLYTLDPVLLAAAIEDVNAAVGEGAFRVGAEAGLPLHHFPLERAAQAHAAVEGGAVGKVLLDIG